MGLIASSSYLTVFGAGTFIGALSTYFLLKVRPNWHKPKVKQEPVWSNGMEERYEFENIDDEVRLVLGVRNDLKMQKGKVAAQCGHGAMAAYANVLNTSPALLRDWLKNGGTKIALRVESEEQLLDLDKKAKELNVLSSIIRDAGQTQVAPGTRTVIAIGPAPKSVLEKITGHLKLY
ncbi:peptidyl-tRNA hydrolase 2, mitochondrial-like isoform X2 [Anthonomus grandis grandis]|uniref:peptidyl-tRNA hydrolase 2, mitochondrial-like isoform X2 n=1 Tax=Anthonomus grandis grandis TaxID=2921223 RepID=UPI0021654714|nr:peptidyl-tRNA hydrolase 2, mitochondrial-like isoform X2 [Anthonomus grandis grandis]